MQTQDNELNEIQELKKELETDKGLRIKAETRLETLNKSKEDIVAEVKKYGIDDPKMLESEISKLKGEAYNLLNEIKTNMPNLKGIQI